MTFSRSAPYNAPATMEPTPSFSRQRVDQASAPRPPQRDPPLPPLPRPRPRPSLENVSRPTIRMIPRKPVPPAQRANDSSLVDASQIPSDLIPVAPHPPAASAPSVPPAPSAPAPAPAAQRPGLLARPPSHGRSMSHPFPSLLPSRNKPLPRKTQDDFDSDSDSDAEMLGLGPASKSRGPAQQPAGSGLSYAKPQSDKDFASGNCMACGALSRWPKGLKVFKCTLCVTINDLVDLKSVADSQGHTPGARAAGASGDGAPMTSKGECPAMLSEEDLFLNRLYSKALFRSTLPSAS